MTHGSSLNLRQFQHPSSFSINLKQTTKQALQSMPMDQQALQFHLWSQKKKVVHRSVHPRRLQYQQKQQALHTQTFQHRRPHCRAAVAPRPAMETPTRTDCSTAFAPQPSYPHYFGYLCLYFCQVAMPATIILALLCIIATT